MNKSNIESTATLFHQPIKERFLDLNEVKHRTGLGVIPPFQTSFKSRG